MNENDVALCDKRVYLCMPSPNRIDYMEAAVVRQVQRQIMDYGEQYNCRVIAPYAYLHQILNYEDAEEMEIAFWFSRKLLQHCDALVVFGETLTDRMRVEIDYAWLHGIPVLSRPESFAAVHEYLESMKRRSEDAQHL